MQLVPAGRSHTWNALTEVGDAEHKAQSTLCLNQCFPKYSAVIVHTGPPG